MNSKPHPVDVIVGGNIRTHRTVRRLSQTELGESVGVTFQQIQKYEKGTNRVSASKLVEIARVLGCGTADLLAGADGPAEPAGVLSRDAIRLARLFDELPARPRAAIRKLAETLVAEEIAAMGPEAA